MRTSITCSLAILILLAINGAPRAQHYTDWEGFEFIPIADELYELQRDYTISLPEYFEDSTKQPPSLRDQAYLYEWWAAHDLPVCDWDFVRLEEGGIMTVKQGYRWDGPSYPWREHSYFNFRSSLIHDALYDLMRMQYLEADHNHGILCADEHDPLDPGDINREMADQMIYMIAVEDGQDIAGVQGALADFIIIRGGGACKTHKNSLLTRWKYHVSGLTACATDGKVELNWKRPDYSVKDPSFNDHFESTIGYKIRRNGADIAVVDAIEFVPPLGFKWITSFEDNDVVNGEIYEYQIMPLTVNSNEWDWSNKDRVVPMTGPGSALRLDGIDDFVEVNNVSNDLCMRPTPSSTPLEFTMEAWVFPENTSGIPAILAFNTISGDNYNLLMYNASNDKFCYYDNANGYEYSGDHFEPGSWYHVAVTIDASGDGVLWVNGAEQATFNTTIRPEHGARFSIGQEWDVSGESQFFKGMIDEVRVWNRARTQEEITADIYNPLRGDEDGLVGLWHFDEPNDFFVQNGFTLNPGMLVRKAFDATVNGSDGELIGYAMQDEAFVPSGAMMIPTAVDDGEQMSTLPHSFELSQNYPNPFNPVTTIAYALPTRSHVTIDVFSLLGRKVRTLVDCDKAVGSHTVTWNGTDASGESVATGVYLYRLQAGDYTQTKKMLLLK